MTNLAETTTLLREGETCWRAVPARRAAFLVDGEAFFGAVADALEQARESVWLVGWDFHSEVDLRPSDDPDGRTPLVPLLESMVRKRPALHVRVLCWDFAMLYALEREFLPLYQFGVKTHRRISFAMDSAHPLTASQHQKLVVVDDALAFVGGFDLTAHRWDTREHRAEDPRRVTPAGKPYQPFHDVQVAVDGQAARAVAHLARHRWERATGEEVEASEASDDPWPEGLEADVRDVTVGIARTVASYQDEPEIREVEALYRESIASAGKCIYIENQYLTADAIAHWLLARLDEPDGPEIVIVGPRGNAGWLEESTMGAMRDRVVRELRAKDRFDRLRVLYPHVPDLPEGQIVNLHSKVMIVDDRLARVGSSNLSNRSLGLDTECDLALEARGDEAVRRAITRFRNGLVAEHLGTTPEAVAEELARTGSLVATVDALAGEGRTLRPLELEASDSAAEAVATIGAVDPEHPVPLEELVMRFEETEERDPRAGRSMKGFVVALVVLAAIAGAWQFTPLSEWVTAERLLPWIGFFRESWYGPLAAGGIFVLASLLLVPVTALTVASGLALGPFLGIGVAWLGATLAAALGYGAGRILWREAVRRIAGQRLNALSRRLASRGVLSSALVRLVPVAPFTIVNLVAGASHVRARDFIAGTALGMFPGTVLLIVAADGIKNLIAEPTGPAWLWAGLIVLALLGAAAALRRIPWRRTNADRD